MTAGVPAIKSQPVYHPLAWDASGQSHLLLLAARDATLDDGLLASPPAGPLRIISCAGPVADPAAAGAAVEVAASLEGALDALEKALRHANMGLRLYLVGPEDAIWQARAIASAYGMGNQEVRLYRTGTLARPVFCVHCRATTRSVRTNLVDCSGCGRTLFVRDHFSRRLGAYMGFQIDAEAPGQKPPVETVYP